MNTATELTDWNVDQFTNRDLNDYLKRCARWLAWYTQQLEHS
jgi:hypothetical protein